MKSKKLLSTLVALSIVATSSIAFESVQAAGINPGTNTQKLTYVQKNLTSNLANYSVYSSLSYNAIQDIWMHQSSFRTAGELADYMVSKGYINRTVAINTAITIIMDGYRSVSEQQSSANNSVLFLKANDSNKYTIIPDNLLSNTTYTPYLCLSQTEVDNISNFVKTNNSTSALRNFLINNNICNDPSAAYSVAVALGAHDSDGLEHINYGGIWIFKSNTAAWRFMAAPAPFYIAY